MDWEEVPEKKKVKKGKRSLTVSEKDPRGGSPLLRRKKWSWHDSLGPGQETEEA